MPQSIDQHINCRLCAELVSHLFYQSGEKSFYRCSNCQLVYVDPANYLSIVEEKAQYDLHQNASDDPHYRRFLNQLFEPMQALLNPLSNGMDFGSGPGPTLSVMFSEVGHQMEIYDLFYADNPSVLLANYDFITLSEVIEHLHRPLQVMDQLWEQLNHGGYLGVMTQLWDEQPAFADWVYKDDMTHVCFFSKATFAWLADRWQAELQSVNRNVSIFHKLA